MRTSEPSTGLRTDSAYLTALFHYHHPAEDHQRDEWWGRVQVRGRQVCVGLCRHTTHRTTPKRKNGREQTTDRRKTARRQTNNQGTRNNRTCLFERVSYYISCQHHDAYTVLHQMIYTYFQYASKRRIHAWPRPMARMAITIAATSHVLCSKTNVQALIVSGLGSLGALEGLEGGGVSMRDMAPKYFH